MLTHEHKTYDNALHLPISILKTDRCEIASHWHYDFEAAFVLAGSITVSLNGETARLQTGDTFICSNGDIHSYAEPSANSLVLLLTFDQLATRKAGTLVLDSPVRSGVFRPDVHHPDERLRRVLECMHTEYNQLNETSAFFLYSYVLEIQGILHRYYLKQEFQTGGTSRQLHLRAIRESISYIEAHFAEEITIDTMAKRALMSVSSYSREFKKITGTGFKDYVHLVRLHEITAAMGHGREGIAKIAYECGFASVRTFNRVFLQHYGITPGAYAAGLHGAALHFQNAPNGDCT